MDCPVAARLWRQLGRWAVFVQRSCLPLGLVWRALPCASMVFRHCLSELSMCSGFCRCMTEYWFMKAPVRSATVLCPAFKMCQSGADARPLQPTTHMDNRQYPATIKFWSVVIAVPVFAAFLASIYFPLWGLLRLAASLGSSQVCTWCMARPSGSGLGQPDSPMRHDQPKHKPSAATLAWFCKGLQLAGICLATMLPPFY